MLEKVRHAALFLVLGYPVESWAACDLEFSDFTTHVNWRDDDGGYSPFETSTHEEKIDIKVHNIGDDDCEYWIAASRGRDADAQYQRSGISQGVSLKYWLNGKKNSPSKVLKEVPDTHDKNHVIEGKKLKPGKDEKKSYYLQVPAQQLVSSGQYLDQVDFTLYSGNPTAVPAADDFQDVASVAFDFPVLQILGLGLGGLFSDLTLDFENLQSNERLGFSIYVFANDHYQVNLRSQNAGVLKHVSADDSVSYEFMEGNGPIDLTSGEWEEMVHEKKGKGTQRYSCSITLGEVERGLRSGNYEDIIYVEVVSH